MEKQYWFETSIIPLAREKLEEILGYLNCNTEIAESPFGLFLRNDPENPTCSEEPETIQLLQAALNETGKPFCITGKGIEIDESGHVGGYCWRLTRSGFQRVSLEEILWNNFQI